MSAIGNLASGILHAVLPTGLFPASTTTSSTPTSAADPVTQPPDSGQISSLGQLLNQLQQLQQSNPAQYQQVAQQIATNLQASAQTAQSSGNTAAASQLNLLAADFQNAAASGQLPNLQHLTNAVGHRAAGHHGGGPHHHRIGETGASADAAQGGPLSATAIIENTLTTAGITS